MTTEQETFWAGEFGDAYTERNRSATEPLKKLFDQILRGREIRSLIEFGANRGLNLIALKDLFPKAGISAVEINPAACGCLTAIGGIELFQRSMLGFSQPRTWDLAFTKGVLIHIHPDDLRQAYEVLYRSTSRYLLVIEYFNTAPVTIAYRGNENKLFKRDFAGELLDLYPDLTLLDYGFVYRRDARYVDDDTTWFLMEKSAPQTGASGIPLRR
jgi:spore coat polysaccharide biosynthesis protein SpsF